MSTKSPHSDSAVRSIDARYLGYPHTNLTATTSPNDEILTLKSGNSDEFIQAVDDAFVEDVREMR